MKTTREQLCVALRLFAGLLFIFMAATASGAQSPPPTTSWGDIAATEIKNDGGGNGTDAPILIATAEELAYLAQQVNAGGYVLNATNVIIDNSEGGVDKKGFAGYYFALSADIDLGGNDWTPIGNKDANSFKGHFDGDGHVVKGLKVSIESDTNDEVYAGLFGIVYEGTLRNLGVQLSPEGITASSSQNYVYAGGLAGWITGSDGTTPIRNCYVEAVGDGAIKATVTGGKDACAGGIVGCLASGSYSVTHCYATVDVKVVGDNANVNTNAGGIAGYVGSNVKVSYTYATGKVEGEGRGRVYTGGICGKLKGQLTNSLALNQSVGCTSTRDSKFINRIAGVIMGIGITPNYATPQMTLNGSPATGGTTFNVNGADTWLNTFEADLKSDPSTSNGWGEAWSWPTDGSGLLPKLKKVNVDNNTYGDDLNGQTDHSVAGLLPHSTWARAAATVIENKDGGNGTTTPILIATAEELAYLAQQVNDGGYVLNLTNGTSISNTGVEKKGFAGYHFALSKDIDLGGYEWMPIGNKAGNPFRGHFDGDGHVVKGLKVSIESTSSDMAYAGLFGIVYEGTLRNLGVRLSPEGITASSSQSRVYAGGLAGWITVSDGTTPIRNCYVEAEGSGAVKATVTATSYNAYAGGIVGYLASLPSGNYSMTHCYATVDVKATSGSKVYAGGIAGEVSSGVNVSYTYATGKVEGEGGKETYTGGICGSPGTSTVTNSLALNQSVDCRSSGGSKYINRIAGFISVYINISSNYATSRMKLNGSPATGGTTTNANGADTWLDTFEADLKSEPSTDNGWASGNWTWSPTSGNLPQLRRVILDDAGVATGNEDWQTPQTSLPASNYLTNKPVPPTPPVPQPDPEPTPPPVYYTVTLPAVEGATTDPVAGQYLVEAWNTFRFYLTVDTAYSASEPVIGTSRYETLTPRSSDGAYLVKYVRTDVEVYIDGLVKNPDPVANETLASQAPKVWATRGVLHISSPTEQTVQVYNLAGARVKQAAIPVGDTRWQLPQGVYIVQIAAARYKVIL